MHARLCRPMPYADFFFRFFPFFLHGPFGHINCFGAGTAAVWSTGTRAGVSETGVGTFTCLFWLSARALSMMCRGQSVGGCEAQKMRSTRGRGLFLFFFSPFAGGILLFTCF